MDLLIFFQKAISSRITIFGRYIDNLMISSYLTSINLDTYKALGNNFLLI